MKSEKAVSLIAILAHGIPHVFPPEVLKEAEAAKPAPLKGREDWREMPLLTIDPADAKDHDDAVHAEPDPDKSNAGGFIATVAIADVAWYVRPGSRARPRGAEARQLGLFPRPGRADAARAHLQRPLLAPRGRGPPGARRPHGLRRRRPQAQPPLPPHHDALGREALLPRGAGRLRRAGRSTRLAVSRMRSPSLWRGYRGAPPRPRGARAAGARHPRAQGAPQARRLHRPHRHPRTARFPPPDRGVHDPGERRGGRDARGEEVAARLPHPRHALDGQARGAARFPQVDRHDACRRAATSGPRISTASSSG